MRNVIPNLDNAYLVGAVEVCLFFFFISWFFLQNPQPRDYAIFAAEVGLGASIAIVVYGLSRKDNLELRKVIINNKTPPPAVPVPDTTRSAERRLHYIFYEIKRIAESILQNKQSYDDAGADAKPFFRQEIESKCRDLEKVSKTLTDVFPSDYRKANAKDFQALHEVCSRDPVYKDGIDVAFCTFVKQEAQRRMDELLRLDPAAPQHPQSAADAPDNFLSVSAGRASYPPRSTIYVRARVGHLTDGGTILYELCDSGGKVIDSQELDPATQDPDLAKEGIFEVSFRMRGRRWKVGAAYAARATYGSMSEEDRFSIEQSTPLMQSDRDTYVVGSDMIITVIDPDANMDSEVIESAGHRRGSKLVIESSRDRIDGYRLSEDGSDTGIFQGTIRIAAFKGERGGDAAAGPVPKPARSLRRLAGLSARRLGTRAVLRGRPKGPDDGLIECGPDGKITIKYTSKTGTSARTVYAVRSGATVELDQKVYTCTDRVHIAVVAPDLAALKPADPAAAKSCEVSVKTSLGRLGGYKLAESAPDSAIFVGSVLLTGFPGMARRMPGTSFGATRGVGPDDGMLACMNDDGVEVTVDVAGKHYRGAALTRWNVGQAQFLEPVYAVGDSAAVRVVDPDMNLDPDKIDSFAIRVTSDSDADGIEIAVKETAPASGIFEGRFALDPSRSSQADAALWASNGDTVYARYVDTTLPPPSALQDEKEISSTARVSDDRTIAHPLERLRIKSISAKNKTTGLGILARGDPASIRVVVEGAAKPASFIALLQIQDSAGATHSLFSHNASMEPWQTLEYEFRWTPPKSDQFVLTAFAWKGLDDPTALCPPAEIHVSVV